MKQLLTVIGTILVVALIGFGVYRVLANRPAEAPTTTGQPVEAVSNVSHFVEDDFTDPRSGWPTLDLDNGRYGYHPPDFYHLEVTHNNDSLTVYRDLDLSDFTAETQVLVDHTDTERGDFRYGLALRRTGDDFYAFTVAPRSGKWQILKHAAAGIDILAEGAASLQGMVAADDLRVDASGSNFIFSINGQPVAQVNDAAYPSGDVGFYAETFDETLAHIHYDVLDIRQVSIDASAAELAAAETDSLPPSAGMVKIEGGAYKVGLDTSGEEYIPPQQFELDTFWIDEHEVTNAQYAVFVTETGATPPESWTDGDAPPEQDNHPVEGVTWDEAATFCQWAKKRLPTEAEWEVAARGAVGWLYPWGDELNAVSLPRGGTYPVGSVAENRSPFGVYDMAGNVWEWVGEPYEPTQAGDRVLHGGGHGFMKDMAYRLQGDPAIPTMYAAAGVRCAADQTNLTIAANVIFQDDFSDPRSGWATQDLDNGRYGYHPPDFYHVEVAQPQDKLIIFHGLDLNDYTVETNVLIDHTTDETGGFRYGLALGESEANYYAFTIDPRSQSWQILKSAGDTLEAVAEGPAEDLRGSIALDTLRIDVIGTDFSFSINGQVVSQISDSSYSARDVGFFVETKDEELAHIHYDDLQVREAEAPPEPDQTLLADDFTDPRSGWPTEDLDNARFGYHPPDFYHLEVSDANDTVAAFDGVDLDNYTGTPSRLAFISVRRALRPSSWNSSSEIT
jgi:formylglycine-generating enzyme required for sulfatase activity